MVGVQMVEKGSKWGCEKEEVQENFFIIIFFFFQAEDGIRDWSVTGVQTCALPIYQFSHL